MSRYSDDVFSTTSSQWTTTYRRLPKKQPKSLRFLSWVAGAPPGATVVKKKTRDDDSRSTRSGASSYFEPYTQMFWVMAPEPRGSGHSSGGSSRSSKSSRSVGKSSSRGRARAPAGPPPPGPPPGMNGFPPPPPMPMPMGGPFVDDMGGPAYHHAPPPMNVPPPMPMPPPAAPMGGAPVFFDVTGQNQPGNPFHNGPPPHGGYRGPHIDDDEDSESDDEGSYYSHDMSG